MANSKLGSVKDVIALDSSLKNVNKSNDFLYLVDGDGVYLGNTKLMSVSSSSSSGGSVLYRHSVLVSGTYASTSLTGVAYVDFYNNEETAYTTYTDFFGAIGASHIQAYGRFTYNSNTYFPQMLGLTSSGALLYAIGVSSDNNALSLAGTLSDITITDTVTEMI